MKFEFSAGGIVFRKQDDRTEILVAQHSGHHGWVFPKGHIGDNIEKETKEDAALREVREETGVIGKILESLKPIEYWYQFEGEKRHKTVYYFVMEYVSGKTEDHDWEMENVQWVPMDEVEKRLTYDGDKKVWQQALPLIAKSLGLREK